MLTFFILCQLAAAVYAYGDIYAHVSGVRAPVSSGRFIALSAALSIGVIPFLGPLLAIYMAFTNEVGWRVK